MTTVLPLPVATDACCGSVADGGVDLASAEQIARVFKALGDPTRVRLLSLIAGTDAREACICDLTEPVGLSQPRPASPPASSAAAGPTTASSTAPWPPPRTHSSRTDRPRRDQPARDATGRLAGR